MDLPCAHWQDYVAQKWLGLDPEMRDHFTSLTEIDDVFKCSLTLTTQDDLDFMQSISVGHPIHKDTEKAAKCREKGNSRFKTRDYTAAALHYTQGICFAPQSSEQLSLCYANRSAALYHLQHYQDSLTDIDRAVNSGYPSHLSHKLQARRSQCLKPLSVAKKAHTAASENCKSEDRLTKSSAGLLKSGISPKGSVSLSPEKGRHLVAVEKIAAGEVIVNDRPYSCVLIPGIEEVRGTQAQRGLLFGTEHRYCHMCLRETLCSVPCEGCSYSRYCSTSCQRDAWDQHHRWECPMGAELMMLGVMSHLALRVTLKAGLRNIQMADKLRDEHKKSETNCVNQPDPLTSHYGDSYLSVFHLLHHLNQHSPGVRFLSAVTAAALYQKLSKAGPPPASWSLSGSSGANCSSSEAEEAERDWSSEQWLLGSAVVRHMLQLRCNAQAVCTVQETGAVNSPVQSSREVRIATAIFPTLSLLSHSCRPNTSLMFSTGTDSDSSEAGLSEDLRSTSCGVTATVRAAKVIDAGQEILHCYGPHSSRMMTKERQRLLQEQYYFLCQCEACTLQQDEEEAGMMSRQHLSADKGNPQQSGLLCGKCKRPLRRSTEEKGKGFTCSYSTCGHHVSSSEVAQSLQEIRLDLEKAVDLMERERPDDALKLLKKTQCLCGLILAETHPLQGELEDATARVYATLGDWNRAAFHLEKSAVAISSQYGDGSLELGRQLFKLAQLHFNGGARGPTLSIIPKVRQLLCLHCGPHCVELQELQAMEDCLQGQSNHK